MVKMMFLTLVMLIAMGANAADMPNFPFVVSYGEATQKVKPDTAEIQMVLTAFDKTSATALNKVNNVSNAVLKVMNQYQLSSAQLEAGDIQKDEVRNNEMPYQQADIVGYRVSRNMTLRLINLANYAAIMGELVALDNLSGASTQFDISNRTALESALINKASQDAKDKAEAMAKSLGTNVQSVYAITQQPGFDASGAIFRAEGRSYKMAFESNDASPPMFIPETITLTQNIHVIFKIK